MSAIDFVGNPNRSAVGDTFSFAPLVQTSTQALFTDANFNPGTFTVAAAPGAVGLTGNPLLHPPGSIGGVFSAQTQTGPNTYLIQVSYFNLNSLGAPIPLIPAGATGPSGVTLTAWRLDVGQSAGGTNPITLAGPVVNIIAQGQYALNAAGTSYGNFPLTLGGATIGSPNLSGVAVLGLGGQNIAGFNLVEQGMFWHVEIIPAPGAFALLGLGGLAATRRRR